MEVGVALSFFSPQRARVRDEKQRPFPFFLSGLGRSEILREL